MRESSGRGDLVGGPDPSGGSPERDRLLTVREIAKLLTVSTPIVYRLCERGELVHVRVSNSIRIAPRALADYLERAAGEPS